RRTRHGVDRRHRAHRRRNETAAELHLSRSRRRRGGSMSERLVGQPGGARIVLVEDHPDAAESLALLLELLGHRVRVFSEGAAALQAAHTDPPDIMVVDIGLPGIDGYEVARRVRRDPALRHAVLIAL